MMDGAAYQKSDDDVRNDVMRRVKEHDLPIEPKQVTVQRISTPGYGRGLPRRGLHSYREPARLFLRHALQSD